MNEKLGKPAPPALFHVLIETEKTHDVKNPTMTMKKVVLERKPHEPWVTEQGDQLIYHLPVDRGHTAIEFTFVITPDQLAILKSDEERYYFLFAVLHQWYQEMHPGYGPKADPHFGIVLHGTETAVENLLNVRNAKSNGAVSNLIRMNMGRAPEPVEAGRWFDKSREDQSK
ncbi:MAG TPA: hypothetical protein ENK63_00190 [Rhodobacterales bacterium]|nr:hypothetical protein [Rhodobacterales bacterium]